MTKKNPLIFTIGFNRMKPDHVRAAAVLNDTNNKADLIASALLNYQGDTKGAVIEKDALRQMVTALVQEELHKAMKSLQPDDHITAAGVGKVRGDASEDTAIVEDDGLLKNVLDTLDAFKKR